MVPIDNNILKQNLKKKLIISEKKKDKLLLNVKIKNLEKFYSNLENISDAFVPPKPKELESDAFTTLSLYL